MFGLDVGPSKAEQSNYGNLVSSSGFATGTGESDLTASSKFMQGILSGDASKISSVLAPLISGAKTSAQQTTKTNTEMGTRSGGTTASNIAATDKVHSDITKAVADLTGTAATTLGSEGAGLLSAGMQGNQAAFGESKDMQAQRAAKWNDIISSIAETVGTVGLGLPAGAAAKTGLEAVGAGFGFGAGS